jgi:hypothetical protein
MKKFILALVVASSFVSIAQAISCPPVAKDQKRGRYLSSDGTEWDVSFTKDAHPGVSSWPDITEQTSPMLRYDPASPSSPQCTIVVENVVFMVRLIDDSGQYRYMCEVLNNEAYSGSRCKTNAFIKERVESSRGDSKK